MMQLTEKEAAALDKICKQYCVDKPNRGIAWSDTMNVYRITTETRDVVIYIGRKTGIQVQEYII